MSIRVIVADDQDLVRAGLVMILGAHPGIECVGEAADGPTTLELATRLRPDVLLVDIRMPGIDGVEVTRRLAVPDVADPMATLTSTSLGRCAPGRAGSSSKTPDRTCSPKPSTPQPKATRSLPRTSPAGSWSSSSRTRPRPSTNRSIRSPIERRRYSCSSLAVEPTPRSPPSCSSA